jgi:hypothetical protein
MFYEDNNIMVAEFGHGDIAIYPGYLTEDKSIKTISLADNSCKIHNPGDLLPEDNCGKSDTEVDTVIRLVFKKKESIIALMYVLLGFLEEDKGKVENAK